MTMKQQVLDWATTANFWLDIVKDYAERFDSQINWTMYRKYDVMVQKLYAYAKYLEKQGE